MIQQFRVKNYKSLKEIDIPLSPIHVLIGQNDSGKTSLLEAIYAFCRSARQDTAISAAFEGRWQGRDLVNFEVTDPIVEFSARLADSWIDHEVNPEYGFSVAFQPGINQNCTIQSEWYTSERHQEISHKNGPVRKLIPQSNRNYTTVARRFQIDANMRTSHPLEKIAALIGSAGFYRFDAKLMAVPASIDENRRFRMDSDGFGLSTLLDDILGYDAERFLQLSRQFCEFFPEFKRVRLQTEMAAQRTYVPSGLHQSGQANGKGIYFETQNGGTVRAQQASDGALLFLGFLSLLYVPAPSKVLLIEEPEKGVYPKRLEEIVGLLRRLIDSAGGRDVPQIIFTTHSPFVLSLFRPDEVTLMSRRGDHVIARPLRDAPNIEERLGGGEFYLGELWYNLDEEELFRDGRAEHHS